MKVNIVWDQSTNSAPAAFKTDVMAVAQLFANTFSDPVTINVAVGYGEVNGKALGSGALGQSYVWYTNSYSYSQVYSALMKDSKTAWDNTADATLSKHDPTGGGYYWVTSAQAKALGLSGASSKIDGYVGFSNTAAFDYDNSNGVSHGQYDFFGTVAHEFSEIMGRSLLVGGKVGNAPGKGYTILDLFHYASPGVHDLTSAPGYFSVDGGKSNLGSFNTYSNGDYGDWASSVGPDAFDAFSSTGVVNKVTAADLEALDVIGWDRAGAGSGYSGAVASASGSSTAGMRTSSLAHGLADQHGWDAASSDAPDATALFHGLHHGPDYYLL